MSRNTALLERLGKTVLAEPDNNFAWLNLGVELQTDYINLSGREIMDKDCFTTCLNNDDMYWKAWYNLGVRLGIDESVIVRLKKYSKEDCLVQALTLQDGKELAGAWGILGTTIGYIKKDSVRVNGRDYTRAQCYIEALELNPELADVWHNLGLSTVSDVTVGGKTNSRLDCFTRAVSLNPQSNRFWYSLGMELWEEGLGGTAAHTVINKKEVTALNAATKALELDTNMSIAWFLLSSIIGPKGEATVNKMKETYESALIHSLSCDPRNAFAWANLAPSLAPGQQVSIEDHVYDAQACTITSLKIFPGNPSAWYNLGVSLHPSGPHESLRYVRLNGLDCNAKSCYIEALKYDPNHGSAWYNLGVLLDEDDKVLINGAEYDKYECIAKGERLSKASSQTKDNVNEL